MVTRARKLEGFPPIWSADARVLVLGSMPSTASLSVFEYYAHPRNAFWTIVEAAFGIERARAYEERTRLLSRRGVAVWDVVHRCVREGSLDTAIRAVEPNPIADLVRRSRQLRAVLCNGGKAFELFRRTVDRTAIGAAAVHRMPSTSPANAGTPLADKIRIWSDALRAGGVLVD